MASDYRIDVLLGNLFVATLVSAGNVRDGSNQVFVRLGIQVGGDDVRRMLPQGQRTSNPGLPTSAWHATLPIGPAYPLAPSELGHGNRGRCHCLSSQR